MAAPKGNKFWELRSKHGRDQLFQSSELLWKSACEYFEWCETNPLISIEFYGKDAIECRVPKMRPFTWQGLCAYLDCHTQYFYEFKKRNKDKDFTLVISRIEDIIYRQKFEGAAAGFLNANIISRDLGLSDKIDQNVSNAPQTIIIKGQKFAGKKEQ